MGTTSGGETFAGDFTPGCGGLTELTNGTTYYFTITALNEIGEGPASDEVSLTPHGAATAPGAPAMLAPDAGDGQVALSWTAPASDGGSLVTGYNVYQATSSGGQGATPVNADPIPGTSTTVDGLANGTQYYFTVKAVNDVGEGAASNEVSATPAAAVTPPAAPAAPAAVGTPVPTGHDHRYTLSVDLSWTAPADNGSAITGYRITVYLYKPAVRNKAETRRVVDTITVGAGQTSYGVLGLATRNTYVFTVAAQNAGGWGANSDYSNQVGGV